MGYQLEASALGTVLPIEWGALSQRQRTNSKTDMKGPRASKTGQAGRTFSQERFFFPQRLYLIIWGSLISIIIDQILQKPDSFKHIGPTHSLSLSLSLTHTHTHTHTCRYFKGALFLLWIFKSFCLTASEKGENL